MLWVDIYTAHGHAALNYFPCIPASSSFIAQFNKARNHWGASWSVHSSAVPIANQKGKQGRPDGASVCGDREINTSISPYTYPYKSYHWDLGMGNKDVHTCTHYSCLNSGFKRVEIAGAVRTIPWWVFFVLLLPRHDTLGGWMFGLAYGKKPI